MKPYFTPKSRTVTASTNVNILDDFGEPVYLLQNNSGVDANVTINGGVAFVIANGKTLQFNTPLAGVINSDQALIALA